MIIFITIVHIIVCLFLIVVVLLQSGNAGDISAAFGGQGSQAAFGPRGAATRFRRPLLVAVLFMLTSVTLSIHAIKAGRAANRCCRANKSAPVKTQPVAPAQGNPTQK